MAQITNKDLYEAIDRLRMEMGHRIDKIELDVKENTAFKNQLIGKITIIFAIIGISINILWDTIFNRN